MSELSELEKRKILRERRAAKFKKNGGTDRLNKITSSNNSTLSMESPLDKKPTPPVSNHSHRISQSFAHDQDPEIDDIDKFMSTDSPIPDPLNQTPEADDLELLLQKMLQNAPMAANLDSGPLANDDFFKQMMTNNPLLSGAQPGEMPINTDFQLNQLKFKKFKNYFTIFRVITLISLLLKFSISFELNPSKILIDYQNEHSSSFNRSFILLELVFFVIQLFNIQKYDYHPGESMINSLLPIVSQFAPPKYGKMIKMIPAYIDIYKIFMVDISIVILFFGLKSIFN